MSVGHFEGPGLSNLSEGSCFFLYQDGCRPSELPTTTERGIPWMAHSIAGIKWSFSPRKYVHSPAFMLEAFCGTPHKNPGGLRPVPPFEPFRSDEGTKSAEVMKSWIGGRSTNCWEVCPRPGSLHSWRAKGE